MNPGGPFPPPRRRGTIGAPAMDPVDVVLVDMPQLLHDIIREQIAAAPGLRVSADLSDAASLDAAVADGQADAVIAGADVLDTAYADGLVTGRPGLTARPTDREGRDAELGVLRPHRHGRGALPARRLLAVVRSSRAEAESRC